MPNVLVIGGGLAGAAAAILLARAGRDVTLLEKSREPHHKVCGEFLSGEALCYLRQLGLEPEALGSLPIHRLRCVRGHLLSEQTLPFPAMSLTRYALDEALLCKAEQAGARVLRGVAAEGLEDRVDAWRVRTASAGEFIAANVFLAQGKHDLRGHARGNGRQGNLIAFNSYFRLTPAQNARLRGAIELHLFRGGYAGLQLVEGDLANLGLLISRKRFRTYRNGWPELLAGLQRESAVLAERFAGAEEVLPKPLALSSIPYGFLRESTEDGLWWLGDQAAVIPSFSGDGMSIALHSAFRAVEGMLTGTTSNAYQSQLASELRWQVRLATLVSQVLVGAPRLAAALMHAPGVVDRIARHTRVPLPSVQLATPAR